MKKETIKDIISKYCIKKPGLRSDFEIIIANVLQKDKAFIFAHPEYSLNKNQLDEIKKLINKRIKNIPLAYILGYKYFSGLKFYVDKNTLIPRPETEQLVELVINYIKENAEIKTVVDIGTGSGCIPIAIAVGFPPLNPLGGPFGKGKRIGGVIATDISQKALNIAKKNAKENGVSKKIKFVKSDLLKGLDSRWNLLRASVGAGNDKYVITANLPYLSKKEYAYALKKFPEMKHEPKSALYGGIDGLKYIDRLLKDTAKLKNMPSAIFLEIGYEQGKSILKFVKKYLPEYKSDIIKDLCGFDRFIKIKN